MTLTNLFLNEVNVLLFDDTTIGLETCISKIDNMIDIVSKSSCKDKQLLLIKLNASKKKLINFMQ